LSDQGGATASTRDLLDRVAAVGLGSGAQAIVPGAYAWAVTVAPVIWSRGGTWLATIAALLAVAALVVGWVAERRWGERFKKVAFWMFVVSSAIAWSAAPMALSPLRTDAVRGIAGMLGWALFALAWAAPAVEAPRDDSVARAEPLASRRLAIGDSLYLAGGAVAAAVLQVFGWRVATAERAILVRVVAVAAGLAIVDASALIAFQGHARRGKRSPRARFRSAMAPLVALGILALAGLLFALWD
jgi:hypothetical protein